MQQLVARRQHTTRMTATELQSGHMMTHISGDTPSTINRLVLIARN